MTPLTLPVSPSQSAWTACECSDKVYARHTLIPAVQKQRTRLPGAVCVQAVPPRGDARLLRGAVQRWRWQSRRLRLRTHNDVQNLARCSGDQCQFCTIKMA
mmetsp:Transcript_137332/g.383116  ORF Transcript_137332/g.383116 Transcript_137332/m.383116 type:complete len:101 (-) Transcript_137332:296-598(-)